MRQMKAMPGSTLKRDGCLRGKRTWRADAAGAATALRPAAAARAPLVSQGLELLELNPVLVHERGAVAVDAVAVRSTLS